MTLKPYSHISIYISKYILTLLPTTITTLRDVIHTAQALVHVSAQDRTNIIIIFFISLSSFGNNSQFMVVLPPQKGIDCNLNKKERQTFSVDDHLTLNNLLVLLQNTITA